MNKEIKVHFLKRTDWSSVKKIYLQGIESGIATFETDVSTWLDWDTSHLKLCRFVASDYTGKIFGWIALTPISSRKTYEGVAEVSVYIAEDQQGKGIGKTLLSYVIEDASQNNIWMLQASIFQENKCSISLFQSLGFREVGYREKIGCLNGVWRNVVLMEKRL